MAAVLKTAIGKPIKGSNPLPSASPLGTASPYRPMVPGLPAVATIPGAAIAEGVCRSPSVRTTYGSPGRAPGGIAPPHRRRTVRAMPRRSATTPPPPIAPPATAGPARYSIPAAATRVADPAARSVAVPDQAPASPPTAPPPQPPQPAQPADAQQVLVRLRPLTPLLAALGKTEADLDRWRHAGLALTTYRTPDGEPLRPCPPHRRDTSQPPHLLHGYPVSLNTEIHLKNRYQPFDAATVGPSEVITLVCENDSSDTVLSYGALTDTNQYFRVGPEKLATQPAKR
jgi:hypothetical protein